MDEKGRDNNRKKWYLLDGRSISLLLVLILSILFYVGLNHMDEINDGVQVFLRVVRPFIFGFIIAYLFNVPVCFFEQKVYKNKRRHRALSITTVYLIAVAVLGLLIKLVVPQVYQSIMDLLANIEYYLKNLNDLVQTGLGNLNIESSGITDAIGSYQNLMENITTKITAALPQIFTSVMAVGSGVVASITAVISSIYMLAGKDRLVGQLKKILYAVLPSRRSAWLLENLSRANDIFIGFINGKLLDSLIIGILCFILCVVLRVPYAVLVAIVVGITNIIPFFGPIIGAVPCLMILVIVDPWAALRFFILVIALQQFDGNILGPKILGDSTGLSAIWVLIAIVVGGGLFGFPGMVLGVPTFAVLYALVRDWVNSRLTKKGIDGDGNPIDPPSAP